MEPSKQTLHERCVAACERAKAGAGGAAALAKKLGISRQAVEQWEIVPHNRMAKVERYSGISRLVLRPDLFAVEEDDEAQEDEAAA